MFCKNGFIMKTKNLTQELKLKHQAKSLHIKLLSKYLVWKKLGYYIPKLSFKKRINILNHDGYLIQARVPKRPKGSDVHGTLQAAKQLYEPTLAMK